jgi:heat shock protein HslJ
MIGAVTRAMCPPESLSDEYLKELSEVGSYKVEGETLYLLFKQDSGTMTFKAGQVAAQPPTQPTVPPAPSGPALSLEGPTWKWVRTIYNNDTTVTAPDPSKYTLTFSQADGRFRFVADCNNGSGVYKLDGQNLTMQVQGMTRAACPPPSDDYIKQLGEVASYKIEGDVLYLMLKFDSGTMTFTAGEVPPAAGEAPPATGGGSSAPATPVASSNLQRLTTGVWKWAKSVDNSGKDWTPANPDNYTVQFSADGGLVAIKADCNNASGAYTADGSNLAITLGPTTLAACPPPTLGNEFLQQLGLVAAYFFDGNDLILLWKMDAGSMKFTQ